MSIWEVRLLEKKNEMRCKSMMEGHPPSKLLHEIEDLKQQLKQKDETITYLEFIIELQNARERSCTCQRSNRESKMD